MAGITSLGAGSGLFSMDLVDQLVAAERTPTQARLDRNQQLYETKISAYGALRSALEGLKSPLEALSKPDGLRAFTAASSDENVVGLDVDQSKITRGSYNINVTQLAQAQSLASNDFADRDTTAVGTGTLTINVGGESTDITIDSSNNTLEGIAEAINDAGAGVSAGVVDTGSGFRLVMSSEESGLDNAIEVSVSGDGDGSDTDASGLSQLAFNGSASNMNETVAAKDALLEVNGIAISRSSNSVEGVVDGATFELKSTGTSTISVTENPDDVADRMQAFVDKYNAFQDIVKKASGYNAETEQGSVLTGDSAIRSIQRDLRNLLVDVPEGLEDSPVRMLADIGIKTDPDNGKLEFDKEVFKEKLDEYPDSVAALFGSEDGVEGIATKALDVLETHLGSDGTLASRTDGLNQSLEDIEDKRLDLDLRMETFRERLISQFSAADSLIAQLNSTGSFVSQQLASLAPQQNSGKS